MLKIGNVAPDFSLKSSKGDTHKLSSYKQKSNVVLIFYPGDQTPVCTDQLCEIRDNYAEFKNIDAQVFGINPGDSTSHSKFSKKYNFQFPLLIDKDKEVAKLYKTKGLFLTKRTVYAVNKNGLIVFAKRGKPPVNEIIKSLKDK